MKRYQRRLILTAIVVSIAVGFTLYNRNNASGQVKSQTLELLQKMPSYEQEQEYIGKILEASHTPAFEAAYDYGTRHEAASFNERKYITAVFDSMISMAENDAKEDLASELRVVKILVNSSSGQE